MKTRWAILDLFNSWRRTEGRSDFTTRYPGMGKWKTKNIRTTAHKNTRTSWVTLLDPSDASRRTTLHTNFRTYDCVCAVRYEGIGNRVTSLPVEHCACVMADLFRWLLNVSFTQSSTNQANVYEAKRRRAGRPADANVHSCCVITAVPRRDPNLYNTISFSSRPLCLHLAIIFQSAACFLWSLTVTLKKRKAKTSISASLCLPIRVSECDKKSGQINL
jgi:hypothetical protein